MANTSIDLKRQFSTLYTARTVPCFIDVPDLAYLMVDGVGDPNTSDQFRAAIEVLYGVSYNIKFAMRRAATPVNFVVMPLEGLFWMPGDGGFDADQKQKWHWTMMIMQPDFVSSAAIEQARAEVEKRHPAQTHTDLRFERLVEGRAAQVLHVGPYASEGLTIAKLHQHIHANGYELTGKHHEIYLSDPKRCPPQKMRTIIRQPVRTRESDAP